MLRRKPELDMGNLMTDREPLTLHPVIGIGTDELLAVILETIPRLIRAEISLRPDNRAHFPSIQFNRNRNSARVHPPHKLPRLEDGSDFIHCHFLPARFFARVQSIEGHPACPFHERQRLLRKRIPPWLPWRQRGR